MITERKAPKLAGVGAKSNENLDNSLTGKSIASQGLLQAALTYHQAGFSIFPVSMPTAEDVLQVRFDQGDEAADELIRSTAKKPKVSWKRFQAEKPEEKTIRRWFGSCDPERTGIAIVTGSISGFDVVDADDDEAVAKAKKLFPNVPQAKTGRGAHFYFQHTNGSRNFAKRDGFDFRGDGGYIIAPPSPHYSGTQYEWVNGEMPDLNQLPELPQTFQQIEPPAPKEREGLTGLLQGVEQGSRNEAAARVAGFYLSTGLKGAALQKTIHAWNQQNTPPLPEVELDEVLKSIEKAEVRKDIWQAPEPLTGRIEPEPYPLDALPPTLRAVVEEVDGFVQAPVAIVASVAVAAVSVAGQHIADIERARKLDGPAGIFSLILADSGERKSTVDGYFTKAIRDWQRHEAEKVEPILKVYRAKLDSWESKKAGLRDKIRQCSKAGKATADDEQRLKILTMEKPEPPRLPWLIHGDSTPESLAYDLARGWPSGGVFSAEAGLVFGSHAMGKDSVMRNLGLLNILWDGGNGHRIGRRTSESFTVDGVRLTASLQIQTATLREFLDKSGALARGSGFLARFLISWPESTQGQRKFKEAPPTWPHLAEFNRRITNLLSTPARINEIGEIEPEMMRLLPEAKEVWINLHDLIEAELSQGGELYDVRDVASKTADNAARLAALFSLFETGTTGDIGPDTMKQAGRIAAWHLNESRRFFGELAQPIELVDATRIEQWLTDRCRDTGELVTARRTLQQFGPVRDKSRFQVALTELEELNRIRVITEGKKKLVELNPAILEVEKC